MRFERWVEYFEEVFVRKVFLNFVIDEEIVVEEMREIDIVEIREDEVR